MPCKFCEPFISEAIVQHSASPEGGKWSAAKGFNKNTGLWYHYFSSAVEFQTAADSCDFCRLLWVHCIQTRNKTFKPGKWADEQIKIFYEPTQSLQVFPVFKVCAAELNPHNGVAFEWYTTSNSYSAICKAPQSNTIFSHPLDLGCLNLVRKWLLKCRAEHSLCQWSIPELPSRVLDVGIEADGHWSDPRLHISQPKEVAEYLALSHRWGKDPNRMSRTLKGNIKERESHVALGSFPQTFQDAVTITRNLGFRYIWIDSLCIIQDSREDWEAEAARMGQYYSGAALTLSPLSCKDTFKGFLHERYSSESPGCCTVDRSPNGELHVRPEPERLQKSLYSSVLLKRGWVAQERLLSPRILHFTDSQLIWECHAGIAQEDGLTGSRLRAGPGTFRHGVSNDKLLREWYATIEDYTKKSLTVPTDKLPALAGIVSQFAQISGMTYVAGLWKEDLLRGLLWHCKPRTGGDSNTEAKNRDFPSWSWAKLPSPSNAPTPINYRSAHTQDGLILDPDIALVEAHVSPRGNPFLGAVDASKSFLKIHGKLAPATCEVSRRKAHKAKGTGRLWVGATVVGESGRRPEASERHNVWVDEEAWGGGGCWCLRVGRMKTVTHESACLLVLEGAGEGRLRRVGMAWVAMECDGDLFGGVEGREVRLV